MSSERRFQNGYAPGLPLFHGRGRGRRPCPRHRHRPRPRRRRRLDGPGGCWEEAPGGFLRGGAGGLLGGAGESACNIEPVSD